MDFYDIIFLVSICLLFTFPFLLAFAIFMLGLLQLKRQARQEATMRDGRFVLKYGWAMKVIAWPNFILGWLLLLLCIVLWFVGQEVKLITPIQFFLVFILPSSYLLREAYVRRIEFDSDALYTFSPWSRPRVIPWSEVTGYTCPRFGGLMGRWGILKTEKSGAINLDFLSGMGTLAEELDRRGIVSKEKF